MLSQPRFDGRNSDQTTTPGVPSPSLYKQCVGPIVLTISKGFEADQWLKVLSVKVLSEKTQQSNHL